MPATHALLDLRMVVFDILELKNLILSVRTAPISITVLVTIYKSCVFVFITNERKL